MKNVEEKYLISVIVPIFNSESTLERCILSLAKQKYKKIEIILVNDGSTDNSEKICKKYEKIDSRIKYYYKKNSGAGDTRNYGIKKANGDYIGFVDSDDETLPNMFSTLIYYCNNGKYDIVGCSNYDSSAESNIKKERRLNLNEGMQNSEKLIYDILYQTPDAWGAVWNKIFRKEIFKEISFSKTSIYEDYSVTLKAFFNNHVYFVKKPLYIHYYNANSLSHRTFNVGMLDGYNVIDDIKKFFIKKHASEKILIGCNYMKFCLDNIICGSIYKSKEKKYIKIYNKTFKEMSILDLLKTKKVSLIVYYLKSLAGYIIINMMGVNVK